MRSLQYSICNKQLATAKLPSERSRRDSISMTEAFNLRSSEAKNETITTRTSFHAWSCAMNARRPALLNHRSLINSDLQTLPPPPAFPNRDSLAA